MVAHLYPNLQVGGLTPMGALFYNAKSLQCTCKKRIGETDPAVVRAREADRMATASFRSVDKIRTFRKYNCHLQYPLKPFYRTKVYGIQKTGHGINRIMKASLRARFTHHKALHDNISIASARRHVQESNHGKSKIIACLYQLQQPWQNWLTWKQSARNIL